LIVRFFVFILVVLVFGFFLVWVVGFFWVYVLLKITISNLMGNASF